jgi:hypothetical protein
MTECFFIDPLHICTILQNLTTRAMVFGQWLDPLEYDSHAMISKLSDGLKSLPDIADFVMECPLAAASLQLDWSLIEGRSRCQQSFLMSISSNIPSAMPLPDAGEVSSSQIMLNIFKLEDQRGRRQASEHLFVKPRTGCPFCR